MFIPDPGMTIFDADLSGADAQIVAWEAGDEDLKAAFRAGLNVHVKNAEDILGDTWHSAKGGPKIAGTEKARLYRQTKAAVHATNYGAAARTVAISQGWTIDRAARFQHEWFRLHPAIREWQERIRRDLMRPTHSVTNAFGYRRIYFDRVDGILPEALAWSPQSTVAEVCFRGAIQLSERFPWVEMLLQVHDSLVFQVPNRYASAPEALAAALRVPIPYDDPLVIQWKLASSQLSWGDCK